MRFMTKNIMRVTMVRMDGHYVAVQVILKDLTEKRYAKHDENGNYIPLNPKKDIPSYVNRFVLSHTWNYLHYPNVDRQYAIIVE